MKSETDANTKVAAQRIDQKQEFIVGRRVKFAEYIQIA